MLFFYENIHVRGKVTSLGSHCVLPCFLSVVEYSIRHDKRTCDQHHNQFLRGLDQGTGAQVRGLLHGLIHAPDTGRDPVAGLLPEGPVR